jgi:IS30 family transposase
MRGGAFFMSLPTTKEPTIMTGTEFRERIEASEYSQRELAKRWGVSHTTIQRECDRDEVRGLYRDAIKQITENHE